MINSNFKTFNYKENSSLLSNSNLQLNTTNSSDLNNDIVFYVTAANLSKNVSIPFLTSFPTSSLSSSTTLYLLLSSLLDNNSTKSTLETTEATNIHRNDDENKLLSHLYEELFSWQGICLIIVFCAFIIITIIGNTLIILAVITTRRLRTVTNCFVMSLAIADLLVGIFVMPPAVAVHLIGSWQLGWVLCDIWISLDVLLCTASILSLCAISVDRYLAVTQPLTYSRKRRSKRLALIMILIVWCLALAITCPPILGWYEPGRRDEDEECRYNQNEGYVIFSAMGSFFIPMAVMIYVYARISCVVASRHVKMANIGVHNKKCRRLQQDEAEYVQDIALKQGDLSTKKSNAKRTLSNQTIIKDLQDTILEDNEIAQCSDSYNLEATPSRTTPFKRTLSLNAKYFSSAIITNDSCNSKNSKNSNTENFSFGNRHHHSVRHFDTTTICSDKITNTTTVYTTRIHQKSLTSRITSLKRENKTTQTLSIVVGGFIACWLPFFINYLITPFLSEEHVNPTLAKFLTWLGWFNSAINPFIYAFYSADFRDAFWRLTLKRFVKNSQKTEFSNKTVSIRR